MTQPVTDRDRKHLEEALLAALLLVYQGHARSTLDRLGLAEQDVVVSPEARATLTSFVAERAAMIQSGVNIYYGNTDDPAAALFEMRRHNANVLIPFLLRRVASQALIDTYRESPDPAGSDQSAAAATDWNWERILGNPPEDECQEANDMSPAPLDDILAVTGTPPPVHDRCACLLFPV